MTQKIVSRFRPALSEELLLQHNFFELYPHDGGGSFIQREILGSVEDQQICTNILEHGALDQFGTLPQLDFLRFAKWRTVEKSCWLSRMYAIVPLAKRYRQNRDEKLALLLRDMMLWFSRNYPAPQDSAAIVRDWQVLEGRIRDEYNTQPYTVFSQNEKIVDYNWFDFQPASRMLHFLHTMYFLRDSPSLTAQDWQELDAMIHTHGQVIYLQERDCCQPHRSNHQALRAMALFYADAACCNPEWRRKGRELITWHLLNDYLSDGMLHEGSPSYHIFETWLCRDAAILAERAGEPLPAEALAMLEKAVAVCRMFRQPDGNSVVLNDGYPVNLSAFLASFPDQAELPAQASSSPAVALLPAGQLASWSDAGTFAFLDAGPFPGQFSHYHGGKNALTLWLEGKPLLVDSGCSNYDCRKFAEWYKLPEAHSTMLVDGAGDADIVGTYEWATSPTLSITPWQHTQQDGLWRISATATSVQKAWQGIAWTRSLTLGRKNQVCISDAVRSPRAAKFTFVFVLHPGVQAEISPDGCSCSLTHGVVQAKLNWEMQGLPGKPQLALAPGEVYLNFQNTPSQRLLVTVDCPGPGHFQLEHLVSWVCA